MWICFRFDRICFRERAQNQKVSCHVECIVSMVEKRKIKESRGRKIWQDSPPFFRSKEKIMKNHIEITNFNDPNLDLYARLSEVQLLRYAEPKQGYFCCGESEGNRTGFAGGV